MVFEGLRLNGYSNKGLRLTRRPKKHDLKGSALAADPKHIHDEENPKTYKKVVGEISSFLKVSAKTGITMFFK